MPPPSGLADLLSSKTPLAILDPLAWRTNLTRYTAAVAISLVCVILTFIVGALIERSIFQLAVVAAVLSAWFGGLGPGLVSTSISATSIMYFMLAPRYSLAVKGWDEGLQLVVFLLVGILMSALGGARHGAEKALRTRSEELETANKELEAFSYTVSHDLRRPLRAIDGYSRILMDDYAGELHVAARRYLELVRSCTQETGQLVDDLLDFAKLGRQPLRKSLTDPSELVQESLDELKAEREGRDVELRLDTLPTCYADPRLLKLVFINLLQNAFKFTRKRETAVIEVGWHQGRSGPIYHVRDNGIGFSMEYADQAFGVFQRLHRSEDYEGTGVGLAIVQRIIQRHGGKIWVETVTDKGATFFFTLEEEAKHA